MILVSFNWYETLNIFADVLTITVSQAFSMIGHCDKILQLT